MKLREALETVFPEEGKMYLSAVTSLGAADREIRVEGESFEAVIQLKRREDLADVIPETLILTMAPREAEGE